MKIVLDPVGDVRRARGAVDAGVSECPPSTRNPVQGAIIRRGEGAERGTTVRASRQPKGGYIWRHWARRTEVLRRWKKLCAEHNREREAEIPSFDELNYWRYGRQRKKKLLSLEITRIKSVFIPQNNSKSNRLAVGCTACISPTRKTTSMQNYFALYQRM